MTGLAVGTVDLDHRDRFGGEESGEPGTVGAGAFHPGNRDGAEIARPTSSALKPARVLSELA